MTLTFKTPVYKYLIFNPRSSYVGFDSSQTIRLEFTENFLARNLLFSYCEVKWSWFPFLVVAWQRQIQRLDRSVSLELIFNKGRLRDTYHNTPPFALHLTRLLGREFDHCWKAQQALDSMPKRKKRRRTFFFFFFNKKNASESSGSAFLIAVLQSRHYFNTLNIIFKNF